MIKAIQIQHDDVMEKMFEYAARAGFKYVSLGFGSSKAFHEDNWQEVAPEINEKLKMYGLLCIQTHLPYYDLLISSEILDEKMELAIKRCIKASAELGAKWCVYHPRSAASRNYSSTQALSDNLKVISGYAKVAKEAQIGLALENLPIFPNIYEMRFYTSDYEDLCRLVDELNDDNICVCWDFGHAHLNKFDHVQGLRYVGNRLGCTHIHNNFRKDDRHLPPSVGTANWAELMPVLKEIVYEGPLTLEVNYKDDPTLESFVAHCYSCVCYLEELMGR